MSQRSAQSIKKLDSRPAFSETSGGGFIAWASMEPKALGKPTARDGERRFEGHAAGNLFRIFSAHQVRDSPIPDIAYRQAVYAPRRVHS